jgi:serine/threonine-protein kinase
MAAPAPESGCADRTGPRALALLRRLLDLGPEARAALIEAECGSDPALRARVLALLEADARSDPGLDAPIALAADHAAALADPLPGSRLGAFQVLDQVGRGGMGTVYRARRVDGGFEQAVAIKVIRRGLDSDDILARFLRERRILAGLAHPNLARLVDGGLSADGRPWFAMEFIDGATITAWCDRHQAGLRRRIELFLDACGAVQHAHERLVVHRDLKPANILIDADGRVRLLDFGIAKLVGGDGNDEAATALPGPGLLTPEYAAPEQIAGGPVGVATDVYALGVILYELLSGTLPHRVDRQDWPRSQAAILGDTPARLAAAITRDGGAGPEGEATTRTRLAQRATTLAGYRGSVRGDLERIVGAALAKDPARRYATVQALMDDLRRWLRGQPVTVTGDGWRYRLGKFVGRHRLAVALGTLAAASVVVGAAGVVWQARQTEQAAQRALAASQRATVVKEFLASLLTAANPFANPGQVPTVRDLLDEAARRIEPEFGAQPALATELHGLIGSSYLGLGEMTAADRHLRLAIGRLPQVALPPAQRADIRSGYAHALIGANQPEQALAAADQALLDLEAQADAGRARARALLARATAQRMLDQPQAALASQLAAVDQACSQPGEADQACVAALVELKYFHEGAGDDGAALASAERAWRASEALHGDRPHPQRVMAAGAYGDALAYAGRGAEAVALLEPTVALARSIYGEQNFRHARALDWLSAAYRESGRAGDALAAVTEAFAIGSRVAPRNPLTPVWLHRMATLQLDLHQPDAAAATLAGADAVLPERLPQAFREALDVLELEVALRRAPADAALRTRLAGLIERLRGSASAFLPRAVRLAARAALDAGDPAAAQALLAEQRPGPSAPAADQAAWLLLEAAALRLQGRQDDAATQAGSGVALLDAGDLSGAPLAADLHAELAHTRCLQRQADGARGHAAAAARIWRAHAVAPATVPALAALPRGCGGSGAS